MVPISMGCLLRPPIPSRFSWIAPLHNQRPDVGCWSETRGFHRLMKDGTSRSTRTSQVRDRA